MIIRDEANKETRRRIEGDALLKVVRQLRPGWKISFGLSNAAA